jgi:RND family efflux transporter MFP subunit
MVILSQSGESFPSGEKTRPRCLWIPARFAAVLLAVSVAGCQREAPKAAPPPTPTVGVSKPITREVTDYADFTGRTAAPFTVDIRARVTGYITKMPFVEGTEVKTDDLLFEIDPRPYQAQLDKALGEVTLNEAKLKLAVADNVRAKAIAAMNAGAISKQDLDKYAASEEEAAAAVAASKANLHTYEINLKFTQVTSPINGQVSRYNLTIGNLVNADSTLLTTVVSQDPMYVYFDVDEHTLLNVVRRTLATPSDPIQAKTFPVLMALADEKGFPHEGHLNFANNVVTSSTGTMTIRGEFSNPSKASGRRLLRPGMFVRVRLPLDKPKQALLVAERALSTDQGRKYLLLVDENKKVEYRRVTIGALQDDGLRVIESGLNPTDTVIVSGLQLVRPKMEVKTEDEKMDDRSSHGDKPQPAAETKSSAQPESPTEPTKN